MTLVLKKKQKHTCSLENVNMLSGHPVFFINKALESYSNVGVCRMALYAQEVVWVSP